MDDFLTGKLCFDSLGRAWIGISRRWVEPFRACGLTITDFGRKDCQPFVRARSLESWVKKEFSTEKCSTILPLLREAVASARKQWRELGAAAWVPDTTDVALS